MAKQKKSVKRKAPAKAKVVKAPVRPARAAKAKAKVAKAPARAAKARSAPAESESTFVVRFASTVQDRDLAYELRRLVFEVEQGVPRPLDRDAFDFNADHAVVFDDAGTCVGTGRAVRLDARTGQIGRMATLPTIRKAGIGARVLEALERMAELRGLRELVVHSQLPAVTFYGKRGYVSEGETFLEEGVPHVKMRKVLPVR